MLIILSIIVLVSIQIGFIFMYGGTEPVNNEIN